MIRRTRQFLPLILAGALALGAAVTSASAASTPSPRDPAAKRAEIEALKTQAGAGRLRVIVELRAGKKPSRRMIFGTQRAVVTQALGAAAWRQRETGQETHAVSVMTISPMFAATVTAAEVDRLAAHPKVRRISPDGLSKPTLQKPDKPQ